jgi:hypothetical protein
MKKPLAFFYRGSTYVFANGGPIDDAFFIRWVIINKSDLKYDDTYFGIWMDPDLFLVDDLTGFDLSRNMAYAYQPSDNEPAVALGIDLLEKSLNMSGEPVHPTSFSGFRRGLRGTPENDRQRYFALQGLDLLGTPKPNGPFDFTGDPVTGTGDLNQSTGDKSILLSMGPFTLN